MKKESMFVELIKLFNCSVVDGDKIDYNWALEKAMKCGYIIHPDVCNEYVVAFLADQQINYNSTFYKTWEDVKSKTRFELLVDQLIHYATTYGTGFSLGNGYVPNDMEDSMIPFETYKVIMPVTHEEMFNKCCALIYSGSALKELTMNIVCEYIIYASKHYGYEIDADSIKNREALSYLCAKLGILPKDKFNLFRYIIYKTTNSTLIIKNSAMINSIKNSSTTFDFSKLNEDRLIALSSIFLRFKPIFLAFKHTSKENAIVINKLRKLAVKHHKPMKTPFWNDVVGNVHSIEDVKKHLNEITNFKKVSLIQSIDEHLNEKNSDGLYIIRNGKAYLKENKDIKSINKEYLGMLKTVLFESLISSLKEHAGTFKFPKDYMITCPSSEKSFIGNYPIGTHFDIDANGIVGIYWRNEWGTNDFDLHAYDMNNHHIGWNSSYYDDDKKVVYSGDMTNANPEATELMYFKYDCPDMIVKVNRYFGNVGSKLRLFYANEKVSDRINCNYMVDPNNVKFSADIISDKREKTLGVIINKQFVLMETSTGDGRVCNNAKINHAMLDKMIERRNYYIDLLPILKSAGFVEYNESEDTEGAGPMYDFTDINKETLIKLFTMRRNNITPENITELSENEIFVFGSNLMGHHIGGAARIAWEKFGAEWGVGVGITGQCYAIPTMQGGIETIKPYVDEFISFAKENGNLLFYVTKIGCGIAGFDNEEIAPLFTEAYGIKNITLPEEFIEIIEKINNLNN